jgi:putative solute:sodium symporter small subunit
MPNAPECSNEERYRAYWRANVRLIGILLACWAAVSYGCGILFVEQLNRFTIGHLPLGFWFAQQGSIYLFVVLIFVYAWVMDRLDRKHGLAE